MKKLSTTILILIIAITANAQIFGSFDRTFRQVTLDSVAAYNDSIYMLGPVTFKNEPFIMGQLLSDYVSGGGSVNYGTDGQFPFMNPAGDGFLYTTLLYDGANLDFGSNFSVGESSGWVFAKQYRSKGAGYRIDMSNTSAYSILVGSSTTPFRGLVYDNLKDTSLVDSSLIPKRYVDKEMAQYELYGPETAPIADTWYSVMGGTITGNQSNGFYLINDEGYVKIVVDFDGYLQFSGKATFEYIGKANTAESIELRPTVNGVSDDLFYTSVDRSFDPDTFYEVVSWVGEAPVSAGDTLDVEWRVSTTNLRLNGRNGDPAFALFLQELKVKEQSAVNFTPIQ